LKATNLILVEVDVVSLPGTDAIGTQIPESIVVGEGIGMVISGQMSAPITWHKPSESSPWAFHDTTGSPITLRPGNTWIELVPNTGEWFLN
jgi:hypothetical protein